jgi:hypothetical protein
VLTHDDVVQDDVEDRRIAAATGATEEERDLAATEAARDAAARERALEGQDAST